MDNTPQFIKIFDQPLAKQLCDMGFAHTIEVYNGQTIYVFPFDSQIYELLNSLDNAPNGESETMICESKLRF